MNLCSTLVFSCFFLLLLPCFSSTCYQTNEDNTGNVSEDSLQFSRIEQLHHLLYAYVVHDGEDELLSSKLRTQRESIPGSISIQFLWFIGMVPDEEPASSLLCGFAFASDGLAKSPAFNLNAHSSNCISEVSCSMLLKFITNLFDP